MAIITHEATTVGIEATRWSGYSLSEITGFSNSPRPQPGVSPAGSTGEINGVNQVAPGYQNATGINYITANFDPVVQFYFQQLYEVRLLTTGQIWPVGYG